MRRDRKHTCLHVLCRALISLAISLAPIGIWIDWGERHRRGRNDWLPYEARERKLVETASFWAIVGLENRRHADRRQVHGAAIHRNACIEVETEAKAASDCSDEPVEDHGMPTTSLASKHLIPTPTARPGVRQSARLEAVAVASTSSAAPAPQRSSVDQRKGTVQLLYSSSYVIAHSPFLRHSTHLRHLNRTAIALDAEYN